MPVFRRTNDANSHTTCLSATRASSRAPSLRERRCKVPPKYAREPIIISGVTLNPTIAFDTFWRFAAERKSLDDRRRAGKPSP